MRLNRIYTRSGDSGQTSLGDGSRVAKSLPVIRAMGAVDELNSSIGVALCEPLPVAIREALGRIQNDLFDLGADLCCPFDKQQEPEGRLRIAADQVERLEQDIDRLNADLSELTSFVLPGGTPSAARLHFARAVCRRAELDVLQVDAELNPQVTRYINRLSDLLFVMARVCNAGGAADVLWVPGGDRDDSPGS